MTKNPFETLIEEMNPDSAFVDNEKAAKLKRVVEMYQWTESCSTDEDDKETCK